MTALCNNVLNSFKRSLVRKVVEKRLRLLNAIHEVSDIDIVNLVPTERDIELPSDYHRVKESKSKEVLAKLWRIA